MAGPTQGAHSAPPQATPTDPVTRSGPPATAPSESAPFRKITPGNLDALDAAIDRDLSTFKKDPDSAVDAHYNLQIEVEAAIKSGLPRNLKIDSRYEERFARHRAPLGCQAWQRPPSRGYRRSGRIYHDKALG